MLITTNGLTVLNSKLNNAISIIKVAGTFGPATATLGYMDGNATFIPYSAGVVVAGEQYQLTHGVDSKVYLQVSGADGSTAIDIQINGVS